MARRPPHILITTPESLNLMLTGASRSMFSGVRFLIVDEVLANGPDAVAQTKSLAIESAWSNIAEARFDRLIAMHAQKRQSNEAGEGLAAFSSKRPPAWHPA